MSSASFSITTLGCKVNQYDSSALTGALVAAGLTPADPQGPPPQLVVINTCCVTATAMSKSRNAIRRRASSAPDAAVLITGCYSDYDRDRLVEMLEELGFSAQRILVTGHHNDTVAAAMKLLQIGSLDKPGPIEPLPHDPQALASALSNVISIDAAQPGPAGDTAVISRRQVAIEKKVPSVRQIGHIGRFPGRQRAMVKVQDGCDAFCSYCIVPFTRSAVWSRPIDEIVDECRALVGNGHKEIVLCGVFLGAYGRLSALRSRWGNQPSQLPELIRSVAAVDGLWRVRLSSLEPADVCEELLETYSALPNVAPHFHLPLQSGSQEILQAMNRQYTAEQFCNVIQRIRSTIDRPAITTDIIVGFPGESDDDFQATLDIAAEAGFIKIHAFPFSAIKGTAAWKRRKDAPAPPVTKARLAALSKLEVEMAMAYRKSFVGEIVEAVVERAKPGNEKIRRAMTDSYMAVTFDSAEKSADELTGQIVRLRIVDIHRDGLTGELA